MSSNQPRPSGAPSPTGEPTDRSGPKFCQECGVELHPEADYCPNCGVEPPQDPDEADKFIWAGIALGVMGILFLPIVLAPLAILSGVIAMVKGRPMAGAGVVVWGVIAGLIGFIIGFMSMAML